MSTDTAMQSGTPAAASVCVAAVNRNMADSGTTVTSSDYSEAGTVVTLRVSDGSNWRCLASNDGVLEDLSITG